MNLFFFTDTSIINFYPLSLHDALPISTVPSASPRRVSSDSALFWNLDSGLTFTGNGAYRCPGSRTRRSRTRSEEHTSELQSLRHLVYRPLLEKKKGT